MKTLRRALLIASAALLQPGLAAAAAPLQPVGKWVIDYGDTACTAGRTYGAGDQAVTLAFRPSPNGTVVRLMVARPGGVSGAYHFDVTTTITSETTKTTGLRFQAKKTKRDVIWINFDRAALDGLISAGEIGIKAGATIDQRFALPAIASALKALDTCNADLRKHWNVSDAGARLAKTATPLRPLPRLFSSADYPSQAILERATGATQIMMMVDEGGAVKDCMIEETSGIATLDAMSCGVMLERAKFSPAVDAAGKPVRSVLTTRIQWKMS